MRRTRRVPILLASMMAAAVALLAGASGAADNKPLPPTPTDLPGLQDVGLHQVWQRQVKLDPEERIKKVWRLGVSVYVTTSNSRIVRIEAKTGLLKWSNALASGASLATKAS